MAQRNERTVGRKWSDRKSGVGWGKGAGGEGVLLMKTLNRSVYFPDNYFISSVDSDAMPTTLLLILYAIGPG